ncbi:MAG: PEP-CTERM system histidine kinase PrsK [Chromatiales bacterium]|nr:PEP-CTERM system histidine kinase PrsK [Chromatiales bacterium]
MQLIAGASFGLAAAAFLALSLLLAISYRGKRGLRWLLLAAVGTAVWSGLTLLVVLGPPEALRWIWVLDAFHAGLWLVFLATLLPAASGLLSLRNLLLLAAASGLGLMLAEAVWDTGLTLGPTLPLVLMLALSLLGLIAIEQVYRNADLVERRILQLICLAVGGIFIFNLFVYSHGVLLAQLDRDLWVARGFVNAAVVPLILIGTKRHPDWAEELFVSRQMVFYSATMLGVGLYLIAMAAGGYVIRVQGGQWGVTLQAVFFAASLLLLAFILFSAQLRARLKVFLAKHFFRNRYDYREEWLRLIRTLSSEDASSAAQRTLLVLADILASPSGQLWVSTEADGEFKSLAVLGGSAGPDIPAGHPLVQFMAETNWIVDTDEYRRDPERYSHAFHSLGHGGLPAASVLVPLRHEQRLLGIARLDKPAELGQLNYEDHDLLKTVGRQVAVFLLQELTREQLAETRQFEAFNRLTAFLMHDLKNLIAQQALVVQNAARFKHNPEFVDDAMLTIERSVARMRRLLEQLQRGVAEPSPSRVALLPLLQEVIAEAGGRRPVPVLEAAEDWMVRADRDKLAMVVAHAVRNAQDATPAEGEVRVCLDGDGGEVRIRIVDTGSGMDPEFIQSRLFRPFDTTKGASGMGIGAYQIREYIQSLGGNVAVESAPGVGTEMVLSIPEAVPGQTGQFSLADVAPGVGASGPAR